MSRKSAYLTSGEFVQRCDDYEWAVRAFSSYYANESCAELDLGKNCLNFHDVQGESTYGAFEMFLTVGQPPQSDAVLPLSWFASPEMLPAVARLVASQSQRRGYRGVQYRFDPLLCTELLKEARFADRFIPEQWKSPWGDGQDIRKFLISLFGRCLYHLVAVHYGSLVLRMKGGGLDDLVLRVGQEQLVADLRALSGLSAPTVAGLVETHVCGRGVRTGDPALQPLIPVGYGECLVPALLVVSSNLERNFLALHARVDPKSFDKSSYLFERDMIGHFCTLLDQAGLPHETSRFMPSDRGAGEIDLVVADESCGTIWVVEAKWTIWADEHREIRNRRAVLEKKAGQAKRKSKAVMADVESALGWMGIKASADWKVLPIVVLQGHAGMPFAVCGMPVVAIDAIEHLLSHRIDLATAWSFLSREEWLPVSGTHFHERRSTINFGRVNLGVRGFEISPDGSRRFWSDFYAKIQHAGASSAMLERE